MTSAKSSRSRVMVAGSVPTRLSVACTNALSSAIMKLNYLKRTFEADPAIRNRFSEEFMQTVEQDAAAAEAKRKQSICSKCRQPVTQEAWTRISLVSPASNRGLPALLCWTRATTAMP